MKKKIFVCFMLIMTPSIIYAKDTVCLPKNGYSRPNVFSGTNFYSGSKQVIVSRKNNHNGQNYYRGSKMVTSSRKNSFDGQTFNGGK